MARVESIRSTPQLEIDTLWADRAGVRRRAPLWAVVGVAPPSWVLRTGFSPSWPPPAVAGTRGQPDQTALYVLRIAHTDQLADLPGLDQQGVDGSPMPSLVRDAVALGLAGGARDVEVALAVAPGAVPWAFRLEDPRALFNELHARYLETRPGRILVLPDAAGPSALGGTGPASDLKRWLANLGPLMPLLNLNRQIAVLDAPPRVGEDALAAALPPLFGLPLAICAWAGAPSHLAAHGWRPASAAVAAALVGALDQRMRPPGLLAARLNLGTGRRPALPLTAPSWDRGLQPEPVPPEAVDDVQILTLDLSSDGQSAVVRREPSLFRPLGHWSLSALWTARMVITRIEEIASRFVFQNATPLSALQLQIAILQGLSAFVREGVLSAGADDTVPVVEAHVPVDRGAPRLEATVQAVLRPWVVNIQVEVELRLDAPPQIRMG